jgi:uncharacterized protein GlcG (DUF336 family)
LEGAPLPFGVNDRAFESRKRKRKIAMSLLRVFALALLGAALLVAGPAFAQQPPAPNPLDVVPPTMPFDVPYGPPITLERAQAVINAAVAEAKKQNWKMNVAVVDSGGNLVAFGRMDGAQLASIQVSEHKARAAATYRRETKAFENAIQLSNFTYVLTLDGVIASRGGIPLVDDGKIIGAIGCSGGTGSQDEVSAKAGAAVVNK